MSEVRLDFRLRFKDKLHWAWQGAWCRAHMLRDRDPAVVGAVLRGPRLLPSEVERISRRIDLPEFVLRMLHEHPVWSRSPRVRCNLALNPRMPFAEASQLLPELADAVLEYAVVSRRVSRPIADRAADILRARRDRLVPW